ncbi:hypothetical protein ACS0TY_030131 [Phlomoides rotata]
MVANNTLYSGFNAKYRQDSGSQGSNPKLYKRRFQYLSSKEIERKKKEEAGEQEKEFRMLKAYFLENERNVVIIATGGRLPSPPSSSSDEEGTEINPKHRRH